MGIIYSLFKPKYSLPNEDIQHNRIYTPTGPKKALVIGINYQNDDSSTNDLHGCTNDVVSLQYYLQKCCFFTEQDITLLCTADTTTKNSIQGQLRELVFYSYRYPNSELWLSFSGHGGGVYNNNESDLQSEVICPSDYKTKGAIIDTWLKNHFVNRLHPRTKLFILMDCCHSGTNVNLPYQLINDKDSLISNSNNNITATVIKLSGCQDQQTSAEYYDQEAQEYQGALTTSFLKYAKEFHGTQFKTLRDNIRKNLDHRGFQQKPMLSFSQIGHSNWYLF
tara:strand:+ start:1750 stop:2586 length:837 start_codon:yes stop_codon:yes gene_type:complete